MLDVAPGSRADAEATAHSLSDDGWLVVDGYRFHALPACRGGVLVIDDFGHGGAGDGAAARPEPGRHRRALPGPTGAPAASRALPCARSCAGRRPAADRTPTHGPAAVGGEPTDAVLRHVAEVAHALAAGASGRRHRRRDARRELPALPDGLRVHGSCPTRATAGADPTWPPPRVDRLLAVPPRRTLSRHRLPRQIPGPIARAFGEPHAGIGPDPRDPILTDPGRPLPGPPALADPPLRARLTGGGDGARGRSGADRVVAASRES